MEGLDKFMLDAEMLEYAKGKKIKRGRPRSKCKAIYVPINIKGCHWVALVIDIVKCSLLFLDSDVAVIHGRTWVVM